VRINGQLACVLTLHKDLSPSMTNQLSDNREKIILTVLEQVEALSRAWTAGGELPLEHEGSRP
jgi:hypothetical protein